MSQGTETEASKAWKAWAAEFLPKISKKSILREDKYCFYPECKEQAAEAHGISWHLCLNHLPSKIADEQWQAKKKDGKLKPGAVRSHIAKLKNEIWKNSVEIVKLDDEKHNEPARLQAHFRGELAAKSTNLNKVQRKLDKLEIKIAKGKVEEEDAAAELENLYKQKEEAEADLHKYESTLQDDIVKEYQEFEADHDRKIFELIMSRRRTGFAQGFLKAAGDYTDLIKRNEKQVEERKKREEKEARRLEHLSEVKKVEKKDKKKKLQEEREKKKKKQEEFVEELDKVKQEREENLKTVVNIVDTLTKVLEDRMVANKEKADKKKKKLAELKEKRDAKKAEKEKKKAEKKDAKVAKKQEHREKISEKKAQKEEKKAEKKAVKEEKKAAKKAEKEAKATALAENPSV
mmetsp:Transcript_16522/g.18691  ORF Transcript_16522/g.18691 Transcript_16522/m.18691 type:complete len:404 (-) Transcript_16522:629-1840(-)